MTEPPVLPTLAQHGKAQVASVNTRISATEQGTSQDGPEIESPGKPVLAAGQEGCFHPCGCYSPRPSIVAPSFRSAKCPGLLGTAPRHCNADIA